MWKTKVTIRNSNDNKNINKTNNNINNNYNKQLISLSIYFWIAKFLHSGLGVEYLGF